MRVAIFTTREDEFSSEAQRAGAAVHSFFAPMPPAPRVALFRLWYKEDFTNERRFSVIRGVETLLREMGTCVVNPWGAHNLAWQKDLYYRVVPAPAFLVNPTKKEVQEALDSGSIRLPFVVRPGRERNRSLMHLVGSLQEYEEVSQRTLGPVLVVRFVPDTYGGLCARYRVFVVGDRVDMSFRMLGKDWRVHGVVSPEHRMEDTQTPAGTTEDIRGQFVEANREPAPPGVGKSAILGVRSVGLDVASVDVLTDPETGLHYVVDVNAGYAYLPVPEYFPESRQKERLGHVGRVVGYLRDLAERNRS
jgi:hypothetical protein